MPHVVCDPVPGDRACRWVAAELVVFYTIARWDQRKAPAAVVTFLEAFTADDPVALVVKTTPGTRYPMTEEWGQARPRRHDHARGRTHHPRSPAPAAPPGRDRRLDPVRVAGLHARGDCFVSLSTEGWGLGAFDAAAYGNPVVITGWGGQLAFLDRSSAFLVEYALEPVQHFAPQVYGRTSIGPCPTSTPRSSVLREVAHDLDAARREAAPLRATVLHGYSPSRVGPCCSTPFPSSRPVAADAGGRHPRRRPAATPDAADRALRVRAPPRGQSRFHLVHYLAIASCLDVVQPDEVHLHCHHLPHGPYWDLIAPSVVVHRVEPVRAVSELDYDDPLVARYSYAHHADFVRLDVLAEHGGLYADLDTLFVASVPRALWRAPFVIGREADVPDGAGVARPALSNALLMSKPGSTFVEAWRADIGDALDGTWANHSCFLAQDLARRLPQDVHVEPQRTFHAFEPTPSGIALLLEHSANDLDGVATIHLAAHLWWDEDRRDVSAVHAGMIDEDWIRSSGSTYARAARRFLPEPVLGATRSNFGFAWTASGRTGGLRTLAWWTSNVPSLFLFLLSPSPSPSPRASPSSRWGRSCFGLLVCGAPRSRRELPRRRAVVERRHHGHGEGGADDETLDERAAIRTAPTTLHVVGHANSPRRAQARRPGPLSGGRYRTASSHARTPTSRDYTITPSVRSCSRQRCTSSCGGSGRSPRGAHERLDLVLGVLSRCTARTPPTR